MMLCLLAISSEIPRYPTLPQNHSQPLYTLYTSRYGCENCKEAEAEFYKLTSYFPLSQLSIVDCEDDDCTKEFSQLPAAIYSINNVSFHYSLNWTTSNLIEFANALQTPIFTKGVPTRQAFIDLMEDSKIKNYFIFYTNSLEQDVSDALFEFKTRINAVIFSGEDKIIAYNQGEQYEFIGNIMNNLDKVKEFIYRHISPAFSHLDFQQDSRSLMMQSKRFCIVAVEKNSDGKKILKETSKLIEQWLHEETAAVDEFIFRFAYVGRDDQIIASIGERVPFIVVLENSSLNYYYEALDVFSDNSDAMKSFITDVIDRKATPKALKNFQEQMQDDFADDEAPAPPAPDTGAQKGRRKASSDEL